MAGGEEAAFEAMKPIFSAMGQTLTYFGPAGSGQYAKMSNQIAIASNMMGVCEAMAYVKKSGLDPEKVIATLSAGAAGSWSLANLAPRMLQGDTKPGFTSSTSSKTCASLSNRQKKWDWTCQDCA